MIETPSSFAEAPVPAATRRRSPTSLSEMLRAVRLTGAVFLSARLTAPFGIVSPKRYDIRMPMAHLRHISVFHLIARGRLRDRDGERRASGRSRPATWFCCRSPTSTGSDKGKAPDMVFDPSLIHQGPIEGVWTVHSWRRRARRRGWSAASSNWPS